MKPRPKPPPRQTVIPAADLAVIHARCGQCAEYQEISRRSRGKVKTVIGCARFHAATDRLVEVAGGTPACKYWWAEASPHPD